MNGSSNADSKLVRRNVLWNLVGQGFPLVLALFFIPRLLAGIGTDRFGALTIVWTLLAYFGFFDLGIGRSLTQLLARQVRESKQEEAALIWTVSAVLGILGIAGALIAYPLAPLLASKLLRIEGPLQAETVLALRALGLSFPFLLHSLALRGILEAKRRFDLSNIVRLPVGLFTYGAPLLVLPFSRDLATIVGVMLLGRILAWALNLWMVFRIMPHLASMRALDRTRLPELLRSGGWFSATGIISTIVDTLDRFFISAFLSISVVAFYTTPYEIITKLLIIPLAVGNAIFPEFAVRFHRDRWETEKLYLRGTKYLLAALFPFALLAGAYAGEGLSWWLNPEFARTAAPVLQWLSIAVLIAGVNQIPYVLLMGAGRPDIPARIHLIELPVHALLLYILLRVDGVRGAAIAYAIRFAATGIILHVVSGALAGFHARTHAKVLLPLGLALAVLLGFQLPLSSGLKAGLVVCILAAHLLLAWRFVLEAGDKATVSRVLKKISGPRRSHPGDTDP